MRFSLILVLSLFLFQWGNAQSVIDSLELRLEFEQKPSEKIKLLKSLSLKLRFQDIKKSISYAQEALQIATEIDDKLSIINSKLLLSDLFWTKTDYKQAINFANEAEELSEKNDDQKSLARAYIMMGVINARITDYDKASEYFFKSLKIFQDIDERKYEGVALNNIGGVFLKQKKYDKATEYLSKALEIAIELDDLESRKNNLTNLATVLSGMGKYEQARKLMEKAFRLQKDDETSTWYGLNCLNLAIVNRKLENYDTALVLFQKALRVFVNLEDENYVASIYNSLAEYYYETGDHEESISFATKAMEEGRKYGFQREIMEAAENLHKNYIKLNKAEEAYEYALLQYQVKDSIYLEEDFTKLSNLELQFEFEKIQQEKRLEQKRKDLIVIIIIISLVLVIIVVISIFSRQRIKSKNTLLAKQKLEIELNSKNKEFTTNVLYLMKKNEFLSEISEELIEIEKEAVKDETKYAIQKIAGKLQKNKDKDVWTEFELRFNQVHNNYYEKLKSNFPELTPNDLRLCAFLKLNMSTKEIAEITGQQTGTIEMTRTRIRKKLGITGTDTNLVSFLSQF